MKNQNYNRPVFLLIGLIISLVVPNGVVAQAGYDRQPDYYGLPYDRQPGYNGGPGYDMRVEDFYDELIPYGRWIQTPEYGRVWIPQVDPDFQPYASSGRWVVTEYGNTWVSDYPWGWAPFHYGRWYYDQFYGWAWVPGREWAPAWVCWRSGGGYYGWAPLGPGINIGLTVNIPYNYWVFVPQMYITSPRVYRYCIPRNQAVTIINNTTIINNVYRYNNRAYFYGPHRRDLEYVTRRSVPVYRADDIYRNGRNHWGGNSDRGAYGANNGGYRNGMGGYDDKAGNGWPNGGPSRGQSNRTGTYAGPGANTPMPGGQGFPGENRRGEYQRAQPPAPATTPEQPQTPFPDNNRRGGYAPQSQQPTDRYPQEGNSSWGRVNRGGMYRTPSGDAAAGMGGNEGSNQGGGAPQRYERRSSVDNPVQPGPVSQVERPAHTRDWGQRMERSQPQPQGESQSQPQQSAPDLGGWHSGNGRRGPR